MFFFLHVQERGAYDSCGKTFINCWFSVSATTPSKTPPENGRSSLKMEKQRFVVQFHQNDYKQDLYQEVTQLTQASVGEQILSAYVHTEILFPA